MIFGMLKKDAGKCVPRVELSMNGIPVAGASGHCPRCNGVATSSSPFQSHSPGDEDSATPNPFQSSQTDEAVFQAAVASSVWRDRVGINGILVVLEIVACTIFGIV